MYSDIKVNLNGHAVINLEMQVVNEGNWPERSLCYLCRAFDNLNRGQSYEDIRPAIQIGLLNFTLFPDSPEFLPIISYFSRGGEIGHDDGELLRVPLFASHSGNTIIFVLDNSVFLDFTLACFSWDLLNTSFMD